MHNHANRVEAADLALHTEGTRAIFQRRSDKLKKLTKIRDFASLAVPIMLAFLFTGEQFSFVKNNREYFVAALGVVAVLQALMAAWSLNSKWDDEQAYSLRAVRDSNDLSQRWRDLAKDTSTEFDYKFKILKEQQAIVDSHDVGKNLTLEEKQYGMRHGLISFRRKCVCGDIPTSYELPKKPSKPCSVCGGN